MATVDYGQVYFHVVTDEGIRRTRTAMARLSENIRASQMSKDPRKKREGLVPYGALKGLEIILGSPRPGPSGFELQMMIKKQIRDHNPSRDEMIAIIKRVYDTLRPIWDKNPESNAQTQLKQLRLGGLLDLPPQ